MAIFTKPEQTPGVFPIRDIRVIDGDAIEATIVLPFEALIRKRIRLRGWWADETEGDYAIDGLAATAKLKAFVKERPLWIHAHDERLDRYGRLLATLWESGKPVDARDVLGSLQLSERVHKERRDRLTKQQEAHRAARQKCGYSSSQTGGKPPYRDGAENA